jgi:hypothetical protein
VALQVLEVNIATVQKEASIMSEDTDADDKEAMTTTFYLLDERFQQLQKDVGDTLQQLKVLACFEYFNRFVQFTALTQLPESVSLACA